MKNSKRRAKLRVKNNNVDLGGGKFLPPGDYDGVIEMMHIPFQGQTVDQLGRVMIYLTEEQLAKFTGTQPNPNRLGMDCDFTISFSKGDIIEI